jgi:hypothetical protein
LILLYKQYWVGAAFEKHIMGARRRLRGYYRRSAAISTHKKLLPGAQRRYFSGVAFGDPAKAWGAAPENTCST